LLCHRKKLKENPQNYTLNQRDAAYFFVWFIGPKRYQPSRVSTLKDNGFKIKTGIWMFSLALSVDQNQI